MSKRFLLIFSGLLVFLLLGSLLFNGAFILSKFISFGNPATQMEDPPLTEKLIEAGTGGKIVQIDIDGMISNAGTSLGFSMVSDTKRMLRAAGKDSSVKGILLRINSPGGEVTASDILYKEVKRTAEKKPVVIFMDSVAASGGYYIACAGNYLMANETTITGSIGVIIQTFNYRNLFEKVGLESTAFTSGAFKDTLSPGREMRPDEQVFVQGLVDEMYGGFVKIVSEARNIPIGTLKDGIADGRIFTGKGAVEKKLIDETGYIEDAYDKIRELAGTPDAKIVRYMKEVGLIEMLSFLGQTEGNAAKRVELDFSERLMPSLEPGKAYFLPRFFMR